MKMAATGITGYMQVPQDRGRHQQIRRIRKQSAAEPRWTGENRNAGNLFVLLGVVLIESSPQNGVLRMGAGECDLYDASDRREDILIECKRNKGLRI